MISRDGLLSSAAKHELGRPEKGIVPGEVGAIIAAGVAAVAVIAGGETVVAGDI